MSKLLHDGILFARLSRLEGLRRGFRPRRIDSGDVVTGLLILAVIVAAVWLLSYLLTLHERRGAYSSPLGLFLSLCKAHRLPWSQRWLLWRVARAQRLHDPARLFLESERLDPTNMDPPLRIRSEELKLLRDRLFAEPDQ